MLAFYQCACTPVLTILFLKQVIKIAAASPIKAVHAAVIVRLIHVVFFSFCLVVSQ